MEVLLETDERLERVMVLYKMPVSRDLYSQQHDRSLSRTRISLLGPRQQRFPTGVPSKALKHRIRRGADSDASISTRLIST